MCDLLLWVDVKYFDVEVIWQKKSDESERLFFEA